MMMFLNSFYFEIFLEKKKKEKLGFITQLRNKYNVVSQKQPLCLEFTYGGFSVKVSHYICVLYETLRLLWQQQAKV